MEPEARYTLVGSVVLVLIIASALAAVWLSRAGVAAVYGQSDALRHMEGYLAVVAGDNFKAHPQPFQVGDGDLCVGFRWIKKQ